MQGLEDVIAELEREHDALAWLIAKLKKYRRRVDGKSPANVVSNAKGAAR